MGKTDVILYFGSFNPIHNGHTAVAKYVLGQGICDELWFVVSPRNPLKSESNLACDADRLAMVEIAVKEMLAGLNVRISDVEFGLPRPSYTIDTLHFLKTEFPDHTFSLLVGADIIPQINKWKDCKTLLDKYKFYVYPRDGSALNKLPQNAVYLKDAPLCRFSSTDIREAISKGEDISNMVAPGVKDYIVAKNLWTAESLT